MTRPGRAAVSGRGFARSGTLTSTQSRSAISPRGGSDSPVRDRAQDRKGRTSVCLVGSNVLASCYLRKILERDRSFEVFSEDGVPASHAASAILAPIFVIDVGTLTSPLVAFMTILRSRVPDAKSLVLWDELSRDDLRRLPFLGIQGFVSYHEVKSQFRLALRAISKGKTWFTPEVLPQFLHYSRPRRSDGRFGELEQSIFTPREGLIVGLLERRLGNKEIANALRVSESTVKFHLSNIFRKLAVHDRRSAAELAASLVDQIGAVPKSD